MVRTWYIVMEDHLFIAKPMDAALLFEHKNNRSCYISENSRSYSFPIYVSFMDEKIK